MTRLHCATALVAATLSAGCDDPLKDPGLIQDNRVLGARVEVEGQPDRASPAPGETATVRWLVADPDERRPLSWGFSVCEAADVARGVPRCAAAPFATVESGDPAVAEPSFDLTVPAESSLTGAERLVVQGVICANGVARLGSSYEDTVCVGDGAQTTLVSLYVLIAREGVQNQNPSFGGLPVRLDSSLWAEADAAVLDVESCVAAPPELPRVRAGSGGHVVDLELVDVLREPLDDDPLHRTVESLQVSHLVTAGELERPYSVLEGETAGSAVSVNWEAPGTASTGGDLVRFYIVGRDLRGGVDWTVRALCVTP